MKEYNDASVPSVNVITFCGQCLARTTLRQGLHPHRL